MVILIISCKPSRAVSIAEGEKTSVALSWQQTSAVTMGGVLDYISGSLQGMLLIKVCNVWQLCSSDVLEWVDFTLCCKCLLVTRCAVVVPHGATDSHKPHRPSDWLHCDSGHVHLTETQTLIPHPIFCDTSTEETPISQWHMRVGHAHLTVTQAKRPHTLHCVIGTEATSP